MSTGPRPKPHPAPEQPGISLSDVLTEALAEHLDLRASVTCSSQSQDNDEENQ